MTLDLRYPIGPLGTPAPSTPAERSERIANITALPGRLRAAVHGLSDSQLDTPYRPGGWTVRQLVHHVADSHLNAVCRLKLALTEDNPTIKPYEEARWAELPDAALPVDVSLRLLDALHERWAVVLRALTPADFARQWTHPEGGTRDLDFLVATYDWHGRHHTAHVTALRERMGW